MIKENNKLIFDSFQQFNNYLLNGDIPLNFFTTVSKNGQDDATVYYISPQIKRQGELSILTDAKILSLPINFIYNTLRKLPKEKYPMVDVVIIMRANLVEGFNAKNITSMRMKFNLRNVTKRDVYYNFMNNAMSKIQVDNYNLFTLQKVDDNYTFANDVYLKAAIFSLRNYEKDEDKIIVPLDISGFQVYQSNFFDYINKKRELEKAKNIFKVIKPPLFKTFKQEKVKKPLFKTFKQLKDELPLNEEQDLLVFDNNQQELQHLYKMRDNINKKIADLKNRHSYYYGEGEEIIKTINTLKAEIEFLKGDFEVDVIDGKMLINEHIDEINVLEEKIKFIDKQLDEKIAVVIGIENDIKEEQDQLDQINNQIEKILPGGAGSYKTLPEQMSIKCRMSILNVKNVTDRRCFYYCVNAWYMIKNKIQIKNKKNAGRHTNYNANVFNWSGINIDDFKLCNVNQFCINNNIGIVLWEIDDNLKLTKMVDFNDYNEIIPLLLYKGHMMLIKNPNKFFNAIASNLHLKKMNICNLCFSFQSCSNKKYKKHMLYECKNRSEFVLKKKQYKLPYDNNITFNNTCNKIKCRYILVADYEAILPKTIINDIIDNSYKINIHKPFMIGYAFTVADTLQSSGHFKGEGCTRDFLKMVDDITVRINEDKKIIRMSYQRVNVDGDVFCCICSKIIMNNHTVLTELGNSIIHEKCADLVLEKSFSLKVIFHNFKNYDSHFIIDEIFKNNKGIFTIPKSKEKYTTIQYINNNVPVRFIDSYSFLQGSLDSLSKKLTNRKYYKGNITKMTFPYEYIDSIEKLNESKLPTNVNDWYSTLKGCSPSINDIQDSINYFNEKGYKTIYEYAIDYMMTDVYLLLEIVYSFKTTSFNTYNIDPLHYFTLPGYAWDVTLNIIDVKPCLLKNRDMIDLIIDNIRGGISSVSRRKWLKDDDNNSIFYFDANNLYGWSMSQCLPYDDFKYIDISEIGDVLSMILAYEINDEYGYIFTVDLSYPQHLHSDHNELPFLPERINDKLCLSLQNKKMYTCHILNLQQAIINGLCLDKVWKIIRFKQTNWLEKYISLNTKLRSNSTCDSDKNFYKLMNNAVFGKTMQNPLKECKHVPVAIDDLDERNKIENKNTYLSQEQWTDNLVLYEIDKTPIMNKPIYIGFVILELSKWKMYDTFYNGIKRKWPTCTLSYMDTDSFVINIPMNREKVDFIGVEKYFDLSVYPKESAWNSNENKGVLGKLKDEFPSDYIKEFICLRSKMYGMTTNSGKFIYKCKGISKSTILSIEDMRKNLRDGLALYTKQVNIKSVKHELGTWITNKKTLTNEEDNKRINIFKDDEEEEHLKYLTNSIGLI